MKRRTPPQLVEDLVGGEYAKVAAGLVRATGRWHRGAERWMILLREDLSETKDHIWLDGRTPVLEPLQPPNPQRAVGGGEVDPIDQRGAQ